MTHKLKIFQLDAFASGPFTGNPAAVVPLGKDWLPETTMQAIALEKNLSETAFFIQRDGGYHIRWFTPTTEVDLCGHATLASAHVLFEMTGLEQVVFQSRSGPLGVRRCGELLELDFPADFLRGVSADESFDGSVDDLMLKLEHAFHVRPLEVWRGTSDLLILFSSAEEIRGLKPDFISLAEIPVRGFIVTAPGKDELDFVSRMFAPAFGINEDPATGSAHTTLTSWWYPRLEKTILRAQQLSARGGFFECESAGERVLLRGKVIPWLEGEIFL